MAGNYGNLLEWLELAFKKKAMTKWLEMAGKYQKWLEINGNEWNVWILIEMFGNDQKWQNMA